ncbi:MAG: TIGR04282 family arsenosugar biosynthesis glycosyltransferase [Hyphomicrobium sp.]
MATPSFRSRKSHFQTGAKAAFAPRLVIMAKEPAAGRVKTRLARGVGVVAATAAYRVMLTTLIARLASDSRWRTVLAVSPDAAVAGRLLPMRIQRIAQGPGDLGQRLQRIVEATPPGPLVIIGGDCPDITAADIAAAFRSLGRCDGVIGPTEDGGYWLVGLNRRPRALRAFDNVRWSSDRALADTRANLDGHRVAELRLGADIDEAADLARFRRLVERRILPGP